jgi:DNA-binding response OmpR family regulator
MTMQAEGYSFVAFSTGQQCLDLAHRVVPRLILLDIQMPNLDGFETCRRLRQRSELANVPIVFLTACKTREDVRAGMLAGGNDFIIKPFDRNQMLARVRHWTSRGAETKSAPAGAKTAA